MGELDGLERKKKKKGTGRRRGIAREDCWDGDPAIESLRLDNTLCFPEENWMQVDAGKREYIYVNDDDT